MISIDSGVDRMECYLEIGNYNKYSYSKLEIYNQEEKINKKESSRDMDIFWISNNFQLRYIRIPLVLTKASNRKCVPKSQKIFLSFWWWYPWYMVAWVQPNPMVVRNDSKCDSEGSVATKWDEEKNQVTNKEVRKEPCQRLFLNQRQSSSLFEFIQ